MRYFFNPADNGFVVAGWLARAIAHLLLLIPFCLAVPLLSLFTSRGWPSWGAWLWTHDNPPQGDPVFRAQRAWLAPSVSGWRGYINRCQWLWRNPLYGLSRRMGVGYSGGSVVVRGRRDISDRRGIPGWYLATYSPRGRLEAFEFYLIAPWSSSRCLRIKVGWKIATPRFVGAQGYAITVFVVNPVMSYNAV